MGHLACNCFVDLTKRDPTQDYLNTIPSSSSEDERAPSGPNSFLNYAPSSRVEPKESEAKEESSHHHIHKHKHRSHHHSHHWLFCSFLHAIMICLVLMLRLRRINKLDDTFEKMFLKSNKSVLLSLKRSFATQIFKPQIIGTIPKVFQMNSHTFWIFLLLGSIEWFCSIICWTIHRVHKNIHK